MLQSLEIFVLSLIELFYQLPSWVGLMTIAPAAVVLMIIQFQRQETTYLPGLIGITLAVGSVLHFFNPEWMLVKLDSAIYTISNFSSARGPIPFVESIFSFFVAPYQSRAIYEEMIFVGFIVYLCFVVRASMGDVTLGISSAQTGGLVGFIKKDSVRPERSTFNELGSGDFATLEKITDWVKPSGEDGDTTLHVEGVRGSEGVVFKKALMHIPREQRNRHILAVAKTGSGKTTKLILPILYNDCLDKNRSTIVIDSKPEMWSKLSGMTRKFNPDKQIVLFNPLDTVRSLSWNILGKIETDTDAKLIANTIISATDNPTAKADSPFFRNNALQVLNSIMVGLLHDKEEVLSMPRIHELVQSGNKRLTDWLEAHPEAIRTSRTFCDLVKSGSQNADTIMSELGMRLAAWDLKAIRATTFKNELSLETIVEKPTLFIVELRESELEMLRPMANVIVTEILRFLTKYAENCPKVTLPRPVSLVVDEFASSLGRLPDIHVKLNTLRSRNVSIVAAVQSLAQIQANYQDDAESVIAGFTTKIFMPSLDVSDAEWASKESGQMTVRFKTQTKGHNKKLIEFFASKNDSVQEQVQQRAVLTPDEVGRPMDNIVTFFMPNTPVFQGHLVPFYKIPEMLKRLTEFESEDKQLKLREKPIDYQDRAPTPPPSSASAGGGGGPTGTGLRPGITNTKGWSEDDIKKKLEEVKKKLEWDKTTGSARKWWLAFENENQHRVGLVLRLAEELSVRNATITEFFLAYVYSNTDNIQANLSYLDYTRLKREEEKKKKMAKDAAQKRNESDPAAKAGAPASSSGDPTTAAA